MHAVSLSRQAGPPWVAAWPRLLRPLALAWAAFLLLTTLYCFGYARLVAGGDPATLVAALGCASRDWLLWALLSPLLLRFGARLHGERARPVLGLLACTLVVGAWRMLLEAALGNGSLLQVAYIYGPRYAFVAVAFALGGLALSQRTAQRPVQTAKVADTVAPPPAPPPALVASTGTARALVPVADILCVTASGNYLELHTAARRYLLRGTMKGIEARLGPEDFLRVHRSSLVRRSAIASVSRRRRELQLVDGTTLRLGDHYLQNLPHLAGNATTVRATAHAPVSTAGASRPGLLQ